MRSCLFVCLGNICRSPIAEGVAKKISARKGLELNIASAGTSSWHVGESPCEDSIKIAKKNGVDISAQRAQQLKKSDFNQYDLIVALDDKNMQDISEMGCANLVKLGNYGAHNADVPDPYFFDGYKGFDKVYSMIEVCVEELLEKECREDDA